MLRNRNIYALPTLSAPALHHPLFELPAHDSERVLREQKTVKPGNEGEKQSHL